MPRPKGGRAPTQAEIVEDAVHLVCEVFEHTERASQSRRFPSSQVPLLARHHFTSFVCHGVLLFCFWKSFRGVRYLMRACGGIEIPGEVVARVRRRRKTSRPKPAKKVR